jgi:hypothetical protein
MDEEQSNPWITNQRNPWIYGYQNDIKMIIFLLTASS